MFSTVSVPFYISTSNLEWSHFHTSMLISVIYYCFNNSFPNGGQAVAVPSSTSFG